MLKSLHIFSSHAGIFLIGPLIIAQILQRPIPSAAPSSFGHKVGAILYEADVLGWGLSVAWSSAGTAYTPWKNPLHGMTEDAATIVLRTPLTTH